MGDLSVRLQPRAKKTELVGVRDGVVIARVSAPPVDGKANAALCRLLAKRLGVPPSTVAVTRGSSSRDKVVSVDGVETPELMHRLIDAP